MTNGVPLERGATDVLDGVTAPVTTHVELHSISQLRVLEMVNWQGAERGMSMTYDRYVQKASDHRECFNSLIR